VPKYKKKVLYGKILKILGSVFHELAGQMRRKILEYTLGIKGIWVKTISKC
jgi:hypothetical protein